MEGPTYAGARAELTSLLAGLREVADRRDPRGAAAVRSLGERFRSERLQVVVAGEFKRGKTTLVNALLGADLLPTGVVPLTSVVTAVAWGEEPGAEVTFADGRTEGVSISELAAFVTEPGNPGNHRRVVQALVSYPSRHLSDGLVLVDLPGVGSVYRHNSEAAKAFLPQADAAIFLTSADPPLSDTERAFLQEVRAEAPRMFFVLNKIDYLSGIDLEDAIAFTAGAVSDALGRETRVYSMSARRGLLARLVGDDGELAASGLPSFERDFSSFLLNEKGSAIVASVSRQARKLVADERNSILVEDRLVNLSREELDRAERHLEEIAEEARRALGDIRALLARETSRLIEVVEADIDRFREREGRRILDEALAGLEGSEATQREIQALDAMLKEQIQVSVGSWRAEEDRRADEAFRAATSRFVDQVNDLIRRTIDACGDALDVELRTVSAPMGLSLETGFTFSFFEVPTILESLLPDARRLLPRRMARRLLGKDLAERVTRLVDKHAGRLRWDYQQRVEKSIRSLDKQVTDRLSATLEGLRLGVDRAASERREGAASRDETRRRLADTLAKLADLDAGFERLERELGSAQEVGR